VNTDERAPLNETPIRYGILTLIWRRLYYGWRRWRRTRDPERYRREGDPPTE